MKKKKISEVIEKYNLKNKLGFNPFKTRIFSTYIFDIENELEIKEIDYLYEENNLQEFKTQIIPMWNVKIDEITPRITTEDSKYRLENEFVLEKNEYVIALKDKRYDIQSEKDSCKIITKNSEEEFEKITFEKINKEEVQNKLQEIGKVSNIYSNKIQKSYYNKIKPSKLRTKADIENLFEEYSDIFNVKGYEVSNKPLDISEYFVSNFESEEDFFIPEYKCKMYIKFEVNDSDDVMYVDYLKFIFDKLKENYPEIHWIGGIDK